jgi:hypothetical protein
MQSTLSPPGLISLLWIAVVLNMVFADMLSIYTPGVLPQVMNGVVEGVTLSENLMLIAAVFIQIPIAMIVVSHLLPGRIAKGANTVAVTVTAAFVVGGGSLKPHYIFFASCELIAMAGILHLTWRRAC